MLFGMVFVEIISSTNRRSQRSLSSQQLGKYWKPNQPTQQTRRKQLRV